MTEREPESVGRSLRVVRPAPQNSRAKGADRCGADESGEESDLARSRSRYPLSQRIQEPVADYYLGPRRSAQPAAHPVRTCVDHLGERHCRDEGHDVHLVPADSEYSLDRAAARLVEQHKRRSGVRGEKAGAFLDKLTRDVHPFF